ncbi:MAG: DUF4271 domain-containing protein [Prevotellaceae bacterium]|nr:DUF4271 domain-containing protein [Prevotellaceae bacterium]
MEQNQSVCHLSEVPKDFCFGDYSVIFIVFALCFFLLGFYFVRARKTFFSSLQIFAFLGETRQKFEKFNEEVPFLQMIVWIVATIGLLLFIILSCSYFLPDSILNIKNHDNFNYSLLIISIATVCVLTIFVLYNCFLFFVAKNLFDVENDKITGFRKVFFTLLRILGICCFIVSFLIVYSPNEWDNPLIMIGLLLCLTAISTTLFFYFRLFFEGTASLCYFFLYLCTLEILPILVLKKLISAFIN